MEPVFRTLEIAGKTGVAVTGTRITYHGLENIPDRGGAVVAINHTSYWTGCPPRWPPTSGTGGCAS